MLGKFTRKEKADSSLDLATGKGGLLVVSGKAGSLKSKALEDIVDEGVQDGHTSLGDSSVWVNLLQHLVDVRGITLGSLGSPLGGDLLWGLCLKVEKKWKEERMR